jgi:hypothetical protein
METVSVLWPVPAERVATVEVGEDALTDLEIEPLLTAIVGDTDDHDLTALLRRPPVRFPGRSVRPRRLRRSRRARPAPATTHWRFPSPPTSRAGRIE